MKEIPLTQGLVARVDDADYSELSKFKWYAHKGYAVRNLPGENGGNQKRIAMHQVLLPGADEIDHEDGNRANNQRYNLRPVTHAQNLQAKQRKAAGKTSNYRGVSWHRSSKAWTAQIRIQGKVTYLGVFEKETDAAVAYDSAAVRHFGEFAAPNFPQFQFIPDEDEIKDSIDDTGN